VVPLQSKPYSAAFVEAEFTSDGRSYTLSSPVRVWEFPVRQP